MLDIPAAPPAPAAADASAVLEPGSKVRKLEDGFFSISGAAVDASGKLYFVDHHEQRIYGWSAAEGLTIERDSPLDPVNLAFDKAGDLLVLSSSGPEGTVYSFRPGSPQGPDHRAGAAAQHKPHPGARAVLPVNYWNNGEFKNQLDFNTFVYKTLAQMFARRCVHPESKGNTSRRTAAYFCPRDACSSRDRRTPPRAGASPTIWTLMASSAPLPGDRVYVSSESEDVTYRALGERGRHARRLAALCATRR